MLKLRKKLDEVKNNIIYEQYMEYLISDVKQHKLKNRKEFNTIMINQNKIILLQKLQL